MNSETHFLNLVSLLYTEQGYTQITRGINTKYHYIYRRSKLSQAMWGPQQVTMTCRFFFFEHSRTLRKGYRRLFKITV